MKYFSPFHYLTLDNQAVTTIDRAAIRTAKRYWLAEFELLGTTTIRLYDKDFDKDTLLKLFDNLEKDTYFPFHSLIFQDKPLLHFLENNDLSIFERTALFDSQQVDNQGFMQFVSPYFAESFNEALGRAVKSNDANTVQTLLQPPFPLGVNYENVAYQATYRLFLSKVRDIDQFLQDLEEGVFVPNGVLENLLNDDFVAILNAMPPYFTEIKGEMGDKLYRLVALLHNKFRRTVVAKMLTIKALRLDISPKLKESFQTALVVFDETLGSQKKYKHYKNPFNPNAEINLARWVFSLIQLFLVVLFLVRGCSSTSQTTDFRDYQLPTFQPNYDSFFTEPLPPPTLPDMTHWDSLSQEIQKSIETLQRIKKLNDSSQNNYRNLSPPNQPDVILPTDSVPSLEH